MNGGEEGKEGGSETGRKKRGRERRKGKRVETIQGGGRKRGSAPRYSINRGASIRLCLTKK